MAAIDDIDPAQASRRATEGLQRAIESLDRHTEANAAATMEMALVQKKRSSEIGLEELEPSALERKFVSLAGPGAKIGVSEPGQLNPDASIPVSEGARRGWDENGLDQQSRGGARGIIPGGVSPSASSPISGMTWEKAAEMENEPIRIPITGDWRADAMLKLASQAAGRMAIKQNRNQYASQAGEETAEGKIPISMAEFQEARGVAPMGKLAGILNTGASVATYTSALHQKILSPMADIGFGASNVGASLGYNPQGGSFGPTMWHGIPNPLAAFGSAAGKAGTGLTINAAEAAIGGSGIGISEANSLREGLASQGWSNQRSGGFLNSSIGGENENLALAFEPLVKGPFKSQLAIEQLAESTSMLKLGQGTPKELAKIMGELPESAKQLHKTLEETNSAMETFAAGAVESGSTLIHGAGAFNNIAGTTGMNPELVQKINKSSWGEVQSFSEGIKPWQLSSMSGEQQGRTMYGTVQRLAKYVPKSESEKVMGTNPFTGKETVEETGAAGKAAYISFLSNGEITAEEAEKALKVNPQQASALTYGRTQADEVNKERLNREAYNQKMSGHSYAAQIALSEKPKIEQHITALEAKLRNPNLGYAQKLELEKQIEAAKGDLTTRINSQVGSAMKSGKMSTLQESEINASLKGAGGHDEKGSLFYTAEVGGMTTAQKNKIEADPLWKQSGDVKKVLEEIAKTKEKEGEEEKAKIELSSAAKVFFELNFPKDKAKMKANEGGPSTGSQAAQPSTGLTAQEVSSAKRASEARRGEAIAGGR